MYNLNTANFEWDEEKNRENIRKHGVAFEEARTAFLDRRAIISLDPDDSGDEDRFILLGMSMRARLLVACYCLRFKETVVRIISARKADGRETQEYWSQLP